MRQLNPIVNTSLRHFPRLALASLIPAMLLLSAACHSTPGLGHMARPRPDQKHWINEAQVNAIVERLLNSARLASREPAVLDEYAALLRYWHAYAADRGSDPDGGVRALNYIRTIHFNRGGNDRLWQLVLERARQPGPDRPGLAAMPIPASYGHTEWLPSPPTTRRRRTPTPIMPGRR